MSDIESRLKSKIENNQWDNIEDFLKVYNQVKAGNWDWWKNSRCKYVNLRVDMRDGGCIISDRHGNRIDPEQLAHQFKE